MRDNDLFALLKTNIEAGLQQQTTPATVKQRYQPTTQGTESEPVVYMTKISDRRYGYPSKNDQWNPAKGEMTHTETQKYETVFQISAQVKQVAADASIPTASDLVNLVAGIVQGDAFLQALWLAGVGGLRVMEIRNPYFTNDQERFEADPSFDFTVTHEQVIITTVPATETVTVNIYPI